MRKWKEVKKSIKSLKIELNSGKEKYSKVLTKSRESKDKENGLFKRTDFLFQRDI